MKKSLFIFSLFASFILSTSLKAQGQNGIGIVFGDPSGLTFQHNFNQSYFADFTLAYSWDEELMFIADTNLRLPNIFGEKLPVTPYAGGGVYINFKEKKNDNDLSVGLRIPLGVEWRVPSAPVVLFGELVPTMRVIKSTDADFMAGLGGRFYF